MQTFIKINFLLKRCFQLGMVAIFLMFAMSWGAIWLHLRPIPVDILSSFSMGLFWTTTTLILLYFFTKLFAAYEKGEIFTQNNVNILRNIGYVFLAKVLLPLVFLSLIKENIWLGISYVDLQHLTIGIFILLNAWIMTQGCELKKEQLLTI